jgi:excisionase family DNA binding protein
MSGRTEPVVKSDQICKISMTIAHVRVSHAARQLGLSPQSVRNLIRAGRLSAEKDDTGRWMVRAEDLERYLADHGRHRPPDPAVDDLERKLRELDRIVQTLGDSNRVALARLEAVERESDRHRAEAATARTIALQLVQASEETRTGLCKAAERVEQALVQALLPGSPESLIALKSEGK